MSALERRATARHPVRVAYIAGSSYSGSTLLGLVLGADPRAVFAGELKQYGRTDWRTRPSVPGHRLCSCGQRYESCPFWEAVLRRLPWDQDWHPSPGFSLANLRPFLGAISPRRRRERRRRATRQATLVRTVLEAARLSSGEAEWVVDSSKSLRSLDELASSDEVDPRVIHLIRHGGSVAGSFKKRGLSSAYGMAAWMVGNLALRAYVARHRLPCLVIDYAELCQPGGPALRCIHEFLDLDGATGDPVVAIQRRTYHLLGGNRGVRPSAGRLPFEAIRRRDDDGCLNPLERLVARGLLSPLHRLLLRRAREARPDAP